MKTATPSLAPLSLWLAGITLAAAGCSQPLNSSAADGVKNAPPPPDENTHTRVIETPPIGIVSEGPTSTHPCERTQFQVLNADEEKGPLGILTQECSGCHGVGGNALAGFDFILDVKTLVDPATVSRGTTKGRRLVIPGDPEGSYLYEKMMTGSMPPSIPGVTNRVVPEPANIPATASEASVIHEWILNCLGVTHDQPSTNPPSGGTGGAPVSPPAGTGGRGATGTGGMSGTVDAGAGDASAAGTGGMSGTGGRAGGTGGSGTGGSGTGGTTVGPADAGAADGIGVGGRRGTRG